MNTLRGRRLAGEQGNDVADLEREHRIPTISHATTLIPGAGAVDAGTDADPSASRLLYRISDVCLMLNLSRACIYRELQRGTLTSVRIGRCRRISQAALERYIRRLEEGGG